MPTDEAKTHLDRILRDWSLMDGDERLAQARLEALGPLETWLQGGAKSAEVVIRAVQTLLADPEPPGVDQRPAVEEVRRAIGNAWATAGAQEKGMLGLQALILAAWPTQGSEWFTLAPLLDSAWLAAKRTKRHHRHLDHWRQAIAQPFPKPTAQPPPATVSTSEAVSIDLESPEARKKLNLSRQAAVHFVQPPETTDVSSVLQAIVKDIRTLATHISSLNQTASQWRSLEQSIYNISQLLTQKASSPDQQHILLWWGQARYSTTLDKPYRRIEDGMERLWWMAVEASELATGVAVAPAASFLMETLLQVDGDIDTKRPLKDWLTDFFKTLRRLHTSKQYSDSDAMKLTPTLKRLIKKDALGLPVSWVHLQAIDSTLQEADIVEQAKEAVGLDLDVSIDRGEWAAWVFRESLLDWRLAGGA